MLRTLVLTFLCLGKLCNGHVYLQWTSTPILLCNYSQPSPFTHCHRYVQCFSLYHGASEVSCKDRTSKWITIIKTSSWDNSDDSKKFITNNEIAGTNDYNFAIEDLVKIERMAFEGEPDIRVLVRHQDLFHCLAFNNAVRRMVISNDIRSILGQENVLGHRYLHIMEKRRLRILRNHGGIFLNKMFDSGLMRMTYYLDVSQILCSVFPFHGSPETNFRIVNGRTCPQPGCLGTSWDEMRWEVDGMLVL